MSSIIDATDITFDLETDCVVIGAGACGLTAALRLSDAGVSTLVLERDAQASGSTSMSSGFIPAAGTRQQQSQGIEDNFDTFAADIQRKARNEANPAVVKAVTEQTGPALDWLQQQHGFQWHVLDDFLYPGHSAYRMHAVAGKTGAALQHELVSACTRKGIDVVTRARVDALIVERLLDQPDAAPQNTEANNTSAKSNSNKSNCDANPALRLCGVRVVRPDDAVEFIRSKAVILACNGYGANSQLMKRFIPEMAHAHYHGHSGNSGDAILWGEQLNVPLIHTGAYQGHGSLAAGYNILITWALMMEGGVQVNLHGERFSNEHVEYL